MYIRKYSSIYNSYKLITLFQYYLNIILPGIIGTSIIRITKQYSPNYILIIISYNNMTRIHIIKLLYLL